MSNTWDLGSLCATIQGEQRMNEQIEKIYGEACITAGYLDEREFLEKFAQLIIRECCDMVNKHMQHNNPNDCLMVLDIKERFGVEE
jgi:hypothetical protein